MLRSFYFLENVENNFGHTYKLSATGHHYLINGTLQLAE